MLIAASVTLVVLAGVYILTPLFKEPKGNIEAELLAETELDRLLGRKAVVYSNLKDLEFEFKMGRLSEPDFRRLEAGYKGEAALLLHELDRIGADENLDDEIEREISTRKAKLFPRATEPAPEAELCPSCGAEKISGKRFCADCGLRFRDL